MSSEQQLKSFLSAISDSAEFPLFRYVSPEKYTVLIKCRVEANRDAEFYNHYAREWIKQFTKFTKTGWIVKACFPNVKRFLYRKVFVCHHSSFNKKKKPNQFMNAKDKQCKAKIDFKIKFINRNTIKNDKMLKDGLNLTIYIDFMHSHGIKARGSFNFLRCSADTDEIFYKYFSEGHTATTAKSYHELYLLSKFGSSKHLLNGEINPTFRHAVYLFNKKKIEGLNHNVADSMREKQKAIEDCGGVLRHTDDYSITVVITPFMKNVLSGHELDCIIVHSTTTKDSVVSFFLVPTPVGALPIACALHSQATEPSFSQAFFSTKLLLENQTLKSFEPSKIMTNQIDAQIHALDAIFSHKKLFVSRASLIEEIWKTICGGEVKIDRSHRHHVMELFSSLFHAENLEEAKLFYKELERYLSGVESASKLKEYLTDIWTKREDYISPNKVIDISLRMLKQFIRYRCYAYNSLIMIDVLLNILDQHWCEILHAHLSGVLIIETYTKFLPRDKRVMESTSDLKIAGQEYRLEGTTIPVTFRPDTMCCNCIKGRRGGLCAHLCAVLYTVAITTSIPEEKRPFYIALAGEHVKIEQEVQSEFDCDDQEENDMKEGLSNEETNQQYAVVKQEIEEHSDPLNESCEDEDHSEPTSSQNDIIDVKKSYLNALRALNDEFRRLNQMFRENPSASNLDTMGRLARELSKIKPVEKINFENMFVDNVKENGSDVDCD